MAAHRDGRRDEDREQEQAAEALDGDRQRGREQAEQRDPHERWTDAERAGAGGVERDRAERAVEHRSAAPPSSASTAAAIRSPSVTPSGLPNSSSSSRGGASGLSASRPPRPSIPVTATAVAVSEPTRGSRPATAMTSAAMATPTTPPSSSGTPASAATTSPGSRPWASDSAG